MLGIDKTKIALLGVGILGVLLALTQNVSAQGITSAQKSAGLSGQNESSDPKGQGSPSCNPDWTIVTSPNLGTDNNYLLAVAAVGANDVWAVGHYYDGSATRTLIEHWNGSIWSVVPSPNQGTYDSYLSGVAVVGANDVWAVGDYRNASGITRALIEHWNGSAWSVVSNDNQGTDSNSLYGVAAVGANDVWAVGDYQNASSISHTFTEHWNGSTWSKVTSPSPGSGGNSLLGVSVVGANDVWAVGNYVNNGSAWRTLIEHWNGSAWGIITSPSRGTGDNYLYGVDVVGANDVWAVGDYYPASGYRTLIEHWNGIAWGIVDSPNEGTFGNDLTGLAVVGANDVWAVGFYINSTLAQTLIEHWDGSAWRVVSSPNQGTGGNSLYGVAVVGADDVWAVGARVNSNGFNRTLIQRFNPCTCTTQYTDVPTTDPFYVYIRCLACRAIVSGYNSSPPCTTGTPCFLPGNNVTRGQMAKFISGAANYQDNIPPNQQTFTDVPPNSTFWVYIERVYLHGIVTGYSDPARCPTGAPCFLPGNNATRGQTAKFVSIAANYQDNIPPNQQTFTDVPSTHPSWVYIERVYLHGIVTGYSDPARCPTGAPCFLPGNNVTRGQTAKFISNAFFPNCYTP
jgi:hypothetical protein